MFYSNNVTSELCSNKEFVYRMGLARPFYREGILFNQTEPAHFVAGGVATLLILLALVLIMWRDHMKRMLASAGLALMSSAAEARTCSTMLS